MIQSMRPLVMAMTRDASALTIGLVDGAAESTALIVNVLCGVRSDYQGKRTGLAMFGDALGALTSRCLRLRHPGPHWRWRTRPRRKTCPASAGLRT